MEISDTWHAAHPRPQFARGRWHSLDGWWDFAFDDDDRGLAEGWSDGRALPMQILVPFPYQGSASGIGNKEIHEIVWYRRQFALPADWAFEDGLDDDLLLHFGAVDYSAEVWINGRMAGRNRGGHVPFSLNIAPYLVAGQNTVTLRVEDRQDPRQPRGKQSSSGKPVRIYYYCTTGIWQGVWLEPVSAARIDSVTLTGCAADGTITAQVALHAPFGNWEVELDVFESLDSAVVAARVGAVTTSAHAGIQVRLNGAQAWSPDHPHLYRLRLRLHAGGQLLDTVETYIGLRDFALQDGQFTLNGARTFMLMVLDQGYWPQSMLAAPSVAALRADVEWVKRYGFNGVRKHQKIEHERWLYWCDRLGLLVWEEMPNARYWSLQAEEALLAEWERAVTRDRNHPAIVAWVPLVESFGFPDLARDPGQQAFIERMVMRTRQLDATRPVIDNDGWEHTSLTDICSIHDYSQPAAKLVARYAETERTGLPPAKGWYKDKPLFLGAARYGGQPIVLSEVGGFLMAPAGGPGQKRDRLFDYYGSVEEADGLFAKYRDLMEGIATLKKLAGICYTQLTDVEHEMNGLLTFERQPRLDPEAVAQLHRTLFFAGPHQGG